MLNAACTADMLIVIALHSGMTTCNSNSGEVLQLCVSGFATLSVSVVYFTCETWATWNGKSCILPFEDQYLAQSSYLLDPIPVYITLSEGIHLFERPGHLGLVYDAAETTQSQQAYASSIPSRTPATPKRRREG